jgi:hypothetical protein
VFAWAPARLRPYFFCHFVTCDTWTGQPNPKSPGPGIWFHAATADPFYRVEYEGCPSPNSDEGPWSCELPLRRLPQRARARHRRCTTDSPFWSPLSIPAISCSMCPKGLWSLSVLHEVYPTPPPFRSGVRKQCRLLGQTAHQAFMKARRHARRSLIFVEISPKV